MGAPWLDLLLLRVQRYIRRYGRRMVQASGTLNQLYVGIDEARGALGSEGSGPAEAVGLPPLDEIEAAIAAHQALDDPGPEARAVQASMGLTDRQTLLLLAAAGPLVSVDLARLYAFAWADFAVKLPSVGFLCELLDVPGLRAELEADGPLVRYQLVGLRHSTSWGTPTPLLHRGVVVPDAVVAALLGATHGALPEDVAAVVSQSAVDAAPPFDGLTVAESVREDLPAVMERALSTGRPRLFLVGPRGVGRRSAVAALAAQGGWGVLTVALDRLGDEDPVGVLGVAAREALMRRCVLLLRGDELFDDTEAWDALAPQVAGLISRHDGPVAITARTPVAALHHLVGDLYDVVMTLPTAAEQRRLWAHALAADEQDLAPLLGRRFTIAPGTIHDAVEEARARQAIGGRSGPLQETDLAQAVRRRLDHALSRVAEPFSVSLTWDDVVLPSEVMEILDEITAHARHRERVYDEWGFRRTMSYGRGLACLFCGPPGTGKTMVAGLIAQSLGREIYRVDLSRVISKWVGETEKNLARVFDEAERAQVILLFDEADSLFATRTEVRGSNDRFANMEINYLLQRMEQYDGMSLLTTNFEQSIDEAFKRRLKFKVDFPMPDADDRARLWERMIPAEADLADGVRYEKLGKRYKLAGGHIKNAVLRAAFYAADAGVSIDHSLLEKAAVAESRDLGRLV